VGGKRKGKKKRKKRKVGRCEQKAVNIVPKFGRATLD
jgi:hypothetical protein